MVQTFRGNIVIHLVLLSGGSGSRLWPLSNNSRSKQFLKVLRDSDGNHVSMVQRVFSQIEAVCENCDITIATSELQKNSIERQLKGKYEIVLEPTRRDTAPAIMLACAHLASMQCANPQDTVIVFPIDTFADQAYYNQICKLNEAVQNEEYELVLLGAVPTYPSEKYGYIIPEKNEQAISNVSEFREKPNMETAKKCIDRGGLWNCGVFAFKLNYILDLLKYYQLDDTFEVVYKNYSKLPKKSFDYEVVEKASSIGVIPYSGIWKDLGTWNTLTDEMADTFSGRVVLDESTCSNVHVVNETGLPLLVSGINNAVVVATHDGILVTDKERSASIKTLVEKASSTRPMCEKRQWGEYRVIDSSVYEDGCKSLTKELVIEPGKQLSYQRHAYRSETWVIVSGTGEIVVDGDVKEIHAGMTIEIKKGVLHSIRAKDQIHAIEVQFGDMLEEDDIERLGMWWKD